MTAPTARLTGATLQLDLTDAPDLPNGEGKVIVVQDAEIVYKTDDGRLLTQVTVNGIARLANGTPGRARRWRRFQFGERTPEWIADLVAARLPDELKATL